ncbi:MAG TPA: hypothetical protein VGI10_14610 [Polyangiaceae bacterium]|jgi:hypothetical protein
MSSDLDLYARVLAELARGQAQASAVLARHGLDEARWAELAARCEAALEVPDESTDASALERFSAVFTRTQAELSGGPASFDEWLAVLVALQRGEALPTAIERAKLTLDRYLTTQAHWAPCVAKDPELLARYRAALAEAQRR